MSPFTLTPRSYSLRPASGQTALAVTFVIGGIIVLFGTMLAFLTLSFLNSTRGFQAASRAAAVARGGVDDAMLQLLRNKDFSSSGYCVPYESVPCPSGYAQVAVTQGSPSAGQVTVVSQAAVSGYRRKFQAVFVVNASSSLVRMVSTQQVPL
ncbi:MAG: hypothetical protein A2855_02795 [Candidatus Liptonbacteria bacterium RIFCSPHIGHO2_01_FULL_57_28]|uniref:Uncharacterized protein n=1 Tax=Candidatus Liptonbacteria bacterium RIFCSPHIGHO2_01_FULL_57_28 TaxID=1798647 RepID=A0A1G2CCN2_9BACT|nr:MAG: hypothetical protein A2855_02795 [Candidatus Liptonbacteria bacterium RIFCSPHIGHO2_01_FULL_57_28]